MCIRDSLSSVRFFGTEHDVHFRVVLGQLTEFIVHFFGTAGYAAGSGTHQQTACFLVDLFLPVLFENVQIGSAFDLIHSPHLESC